MKAVATLFLAMTVASFAPQSVAYWWPSQLLKRYFGSSDQTTLPAATAALYEANGILHPTTSAPETAPPTTTNQEVADPAVTPTLATSEVLDGDPVPRPLSDNLVAGAVVSTDATSQATTFTPKATTHVQLTETVTASSTRVFAPVETFVFASDTDSPDDGAFKPHTDDLSVAHVATTSLEATEPTPTAQYVTTISSPSLLELADATMPAPASGFMDSTTSVAANEVNSDTKTAAPGQLATSPFIGGVETASSPSHFATSDDVKHLEDVSTSAAETQTSVPKTYMVPYVSDAGSDSNTVTIDGVETGSTMFSVLTSDGTFRTPTDDYTVATTESLTFATNMATLTSFSIVTPTALSQSPSTSNDMEVTAIRATKDDSSTTTGNGEYLPVTEPEADYTTFATALSATRPGTISAEEIGQVPPAITAPSAVSIKMDTSTTASPTSYTTKPQNVTPSEDYVDLDVTSVLQQAPTSSSMSSSSSGQTHSSHKEVDYGTTTTTATTSTSRRYKPVHVRRFTPWIIARRPSSTPAVTATPSSTTVRPQGERDSLDTQQASTIESASKHGVTVMYESKNPTVAHGASTRRTTKRPPSDTLVVPESFFATRALFNRFGRPYCPGCDALLIKLPDRFSLPRLPPYVYG